MRKDNDGQTALVFEYRLWVGKYRAWMSMEIVT